MAVGHCYKAGHAIDSHLAGGIAAWKAAGLPTVTLDSGTGQVLDRH
jgi:rhodanese-related sulfurtransferase